MKNGHNGNGNGHAHPFDEPPDFGDDEPNIPEPDTRTWIFDFFPTTSWWLERTLPPRDYLLGELLSTTSRMMLVGPTGRGKTSFALALAMALAHGHDFLHWHGVRPARVLFIDGEMAAQTMQERLQDEVARQGGVPEDNLLVLNREDYPDMPPLNTPEGQRFMDQFLDFIGPVELIIFDNLQALLTGEMKDPEQWAKLLPWVRNLTMRKIGQLWIHHTNEEGKSYGDKSREWQLDTVALMERIETSPADIAFTLSFSKARGRNPTNRADFEPAEIVLENNQWSSTRGAPRPAKANRHLEDVALDALREALIQAGSEPGDHRVPVSTVCVSMDLWKRYFTRNYIGAGTDKTIERKFYILAAKLQANQKIRVEKPWIWEAR